MQAVDIDLLGTESTPQFFLAAVRKFRLDIGNLTAQIQLGNLLLSGLSFRPEILEADEEIPVFGLVLFGQEILIDLALGGKMVDHVVIHHVIAVRQGQDILPGPELRAHLFIRYRSESPVCGRRKKGQNMQSVDRSFQIIGQYPVQILQVIPEAVRISN